MPNSPPALLRHPLATALASQGIGLLFALLLGFLIPELRLYPVALAAIQGAGAAIASHHLGAPSWWQLIHLIFGPALLLGTRLALPPWVWLAGFAILYLIFGRTDRTRVPLYLTNSTTANALAGLIPRHPCFFIDLGCGDGGVIRQLARKHPESEFVGVEHAWLTVCWAWVFSRHLPNAHIRRANFWGQPLTPYDVAYAFLSPAPMPEMWAKARAEMRPGTLFISNSFPVPDVEASEVIHIDDRRATLLYVYRIPDERESAPAAKDAQ